MRRCERSDRQWDRIASFFQDPTHADGRGRPWNDPRTVLIGIRRLATRYEKRAVHYRILCMVATIERLLRKTLPEK